MKKFILFAIMIIGVNIAFANTPIDTTSVSFTEVYRDSKIATQTIYSDAKEAIKELGAALKVGSEHVYEVLVRQQYVKSITWLLIGLILILQLTHFKFWNNKINLWDEQNRDPFGWYMGVVLLSIIPAVAGLIVLIVHGLDIIQGFINPEYGAMMDIVEMIKSIR